MKYNPKKKRKTNKEKDYNNSSRLWELPSSTRGERTYSWEFLVGVYRPVMAGSPNPSSISDQKMNVIVSTPAFRPGLMFSSLQSNVFKTDTEGGIESVGFDQNANKKIS